MIHALERFLEWGGVKKDVTCLVLSGIALLVSIFDLLPQLPFDAAWAASKGSWLSAIRYLVSHHLE